MKKISKVLLAAVVSFMMMFTFVGPRSDAFTYTKDGIQSTVPSTSSTTSSASESSKKAKSAISEIESKLGTSNPDTSAASEIGAAIINWIWGISVVVAVIVLMIIGLKFILGSTSEKAEYKKSLIPVAVGILILVFATTIVKVLFGFAK